LLFFFILNKLSWKCCVRTGLSFWVKLGHTLSSALRRQRARSGVWKSAFIKERETKYGDRVNAGKGLQKPRITP